MIKRIKAIDLPCYEVSYNNALYLICPCADAECFAEDSLRRLLVSEDGRQILAVIAISNTDGEIKIKALTLF